MKESENMSGTSAETQSNADGLWRWLAGGLAGGGVVLGLLIAAYAVGYHRGQDHVRSTESATARASSTTSSTATPPSNPTSTLGPVTATPALVARGERSTRPTDAQRATRSTARQESAPSFKGLAGSHDPLTDGQTVTANDAYLEQSIATPTPRSSRATDQASCPQPSRASTSPASQTTSAPSSPSSKSRNKHRHGTATTARIVRPDTAKVVLA